MSLKITPVCVNALLLCLVVYSCELGTLTAVASSQRSSASARSAPARPTGVSRPSTLARPGAGHPIYGPQNRFNPTRPTSTFHSSPLSNNGQRLAGHSTLQPTPPSMHKGLTSSSTARPVITSTGTSGSSRVFHPTPAQQHALLLYSSRDSSRQGLQFEQNNQHQQALAQYQATVATLASARNSLGPGFQPRTDVPLAKSHLDVARELARTNNEAAVKVEITSAKKILMAGIADNTVPEVWLWRTYYLLGDANLMERDVSNAAFNYRQAAELNPCFLPAVAMSQYLDGTSNPVSAPDDCPAQPVDQTSAAAQSQPSLTYQTTNASYTVPVTPSGTGYQLSSPNSAPGPESTGSPAPIRTQTQVQPQTQAPVRNAASLSNLMSNLTTARKIQYGGATLSLIAGALAIAELGPWAAAISLVGMIVEDTSKSAVAMPNPTATP